MAAIDIAAWLREAPAQAIGWALLQFVWQGAVVGMLTALTLAALRRSAADIRYVVAAIGLALMLTLPVVTGVQRYQALGVEPGVAFTQGTDAARSTDKMPPPAHVVAAAPDAVAAAPWAADPGARVGVDPWRRLRGTWAESLLPTLMVVWLAGVSILSLRLFTGWWWVQRLRSRGVSAADEACVQMAARLARRLHITRAVTLLQSSLVDVPTVVGFLAPVVLLPASALAGLTAQQVEAILAHELAHIRRHDYLVNLLQTLVETILFYHPAVWWLSRQIRIERENCCDDLAVNLCGDPVAYAAALADLEVLRSSGPAPDHHIAMAATGGSLLHRVRRLLGAPSSHSGRGPAWLAGAVALLLVAGIVVSADAAAPTRPAPPATRAASGGDAPVTIDAPSAAPAADSIAFASSARTPEAARRADAADAGDATHAADAGDATHAGTLQAAPPAPPAPPASPAAPGPQTVRVSHRADNQSGNWIFSSNGDKLEVTYKGTFEFTDDDTDVRDISSGGSLKISDGKWLGRHSVEIRPVNGGLERHYYVNGSERPFEPEGRSWLHENLPKFVRNTGIGAATRVARRLKSGGPAAVLAEIGRIDTAYVKGIYFRELFKQGSLSGEQYRQAMAQASREMQGASYELAQMLIAVSANLPDDERSRAGYFQAAAAVHSDYELRRVYSAMLQRGPVSPAILGDILANAKSIQSDYEVSELLRQVLSQQSLDDRNRAAFFSVVSTIGNAYERRRVLSALISGQRPSDPALLQSALTAAAALHSDYETSAFLQDVLKQNGVEGGLRAPFFAAVDAINGGYERGRVLQTVVRRRGISQDTLRGVLQSARGLNGYELSQLLQLAASTQDISGDVREAYVRVAERLGEYEHGQVMAALVKGERRQ